MVSYKNKLDHAANVGLDVLTRFMENMAKRSGRVDVSDDDRLAAKLGLGTASTAVRLVSAETNRMAIELARERYVASLPANAKALPAGAES